MQTLWVISTIVIFALVLVLGFLLVGVLRVLGVLEWRIDQLEATRPSRIGRSGLKPGTKAPDFSLPDVMATDVHLSQFMGNKVLLVFTQTGCAPCHHIMPDLNRLQHDEEMQVLVVNNGAPEATQEWVDETHPEFPVLIQKNWQVSRRYETFATPFAFLINEDGVISSKGIINNARHIRYLKTAATTGTSGEQNGNTPTNAEVDQSQDSVAVST